MNQLSRKSQLRLSSLFAGLTLVWPLGAQAHCPLCTAGAGVLAVAAASLGISPVIVGVLIGAFGWALGLWPAGLVKRRVIPLQRSVITLATFLLTVLPLQPLVQAYAPLHLALWGAYGSLWHNTYTVNLYLVGSVLGAVIVAGAPAVSRSVTGLRGQTWPFQGVSITILLLIAVSVLIQLLV